MSFSKRKTMLWSEDNITIKEKWPLQICTTTTDTKHPSEYNSQWVKQANHSEFNSESPPYFLVMEQTQWRLKIKQIMVL